MPRPNKVTTNEVLTASTVRAIAYILLVQERPLEDCADALKHLGVTLEIVTKVREAKLARELWIDAIAYYGRQGLIT